MANFEQQYCRLCLMVVSEEHCEEIKDAAWDTLNFLLLKLDFDDSDKQVMCNDCSGKLREAFKFKSMCLCTDNTIIPYVDFETKCSVDLREIYAKEMGKNQLIDKLNDFKVCRLCMHPIIGNFTSVHEIEADAIDKYIPEINLNSVEDAVICAPCSDSVCTHGSFIRKCLVIEEKIKGFRDNKISYSPPSASPLNPCKTEAITPEEFKIEKTCLDAQEQYMQPYIKTEEINIKVEESDQESGSSSLFEGTIKNNKRECVTERTYERKFEVPLNAPTNFKCTLNAHQQKHKSRSVIQRYKCDMCDYGTKYKSVLTKHQLKHKDSSEVEMYNCEMCDYGTKYKSALKLHQLQHKNPSEIQMYKCNVCSYESKHKTTLKMHQLTHNDISEIQRYECDVCNFKSKFKRNLTLHQLIHQDPSEIQMYKCNVCCFESKRKAGLKRHELKHKIPTEVEMHKCDACDYETKYKNTLKEHMLIHKDPSEVQMYKCDVCNYESRYKTYVNKHQLMHKDPSAIQLYKCDACNYETKYRSGLISHQLVHKNPSKMQMYKCDACSYEAKRKGNLKQHRRIHGESSNALEQKCEKNASEMLNI